MQNMIYRSYIIVFVYMEKRKGRTCLRFKTNNAKLHPVFFNKFYKNRYDSLKIIRRVKKTAACEIRRVILIS